MTFLRRLLAFVLGFALLVGEAPAALAQSSGETGIIQITVENAGSHAPLGDARVFLLGPSVASALTTKSGIVKYTDVPSGLYRVRVSKSGFAGATSAQFELLGNKEVDVVVALGPPRPPAGEAASSATAGTASTLQVIGRVQAHVTVSTHDVDDNSPIRKISDSLTDALGTLAGVDVTQDSNDPNAPQTISLRGMDESQTGVTLDGIPLGAPGATTDLRRINTDLFSGASASFGPQAGALAGTVNFRTLQPTQTWQSRLSTSYGTFDRFNYQLGETGSIGKLGIALLHTDRQSNAPLTFQQYTDASGLTYPHAGEAANRGDFVKLRYSLGDRTTLNLTGLQNNQSTAQLCTAFVTLEPCGIGPGNDHTGRFQFGYASVQTLLGDMTFSLTGYANSNQSIADDLNRVVNGISLPSETQTESIARGVAFSSTVAKGRHTITLSGSTYASTTTFTPIVTSAAGFVVPSTNAVASRALQLADSIKASDKLTLGLNLSQAGTSGAGGSSVVGVSAGWRPTAADQYSAALSVGSSQPAAGIVRSWSDPTAAQVNCYAGTATVSGPGDQNGPQSALSYQLGWQHQWRTGTITANMYRQSQTGQLINALITGSTAGIPAGYLAAIQQYYAQPTVCGAAYPFAGLYVNEAIGGTSRVYQGFDVTARLALGRNVVVIPSYTTSSAVVTAADLRLLGANSTTILGAQIPGRPLHKGNLTIDAQEPHSGTEFLANASYVGADNAQHIAPYTLVNAGISHQLGIGRLTLFATNLFGTETGLFSTLDYAEPIPLSGGGYLLTAGRPNPPRQFTVTYSFNTGANRGAGYARPRPAPSGAGRDVAAAGENAPGAPSNRLRGQFRFEPPPAGTDPLSLAAGRPSCPRRAAAGPAAPRRGQGRRRRVCRRSAPALDRAVHRRGPRRPARQLVPAAAAELRPGPRRAGRARRPAGGRPAGLRRSGPRRGSPSDRPGLRRPAAGRCRAAASALDPPRGSRAARELPGVRRLRVHHRARAERREGEGNRAEPARLRVRTDRWTVLRATARPGDGWGQREIMEAT